MGRRHRLRFAACEFDPERGELLRGGAALELTPQVGGLLTYLLDNRERWVGRDELLDQVWGDVVVSYGALSTAVYELRLALGDDGQRQTVIQTRRGRGFRFVAPVEEIADTAEPAAAQPERGGETPFIGRHGLLQRLEAARATAAQSQARVVLIEGQAGIGKTSLMRHFCAGVRGAPVWLGRCYEHAGAPPFWPWTQILREPMAAADPSELRRLFGPRAAVLMGLAPARREATGRRAPAAQAAEARFQLFDGVAALLRRAAQSTGVVLGLDDVHCADHASLLLLEFLAAELGPARVLVLATFRREDAGDGAVETLAAIARSPATERHVLQGLEASEVRALLAALPGLSPSPAAIERIVRRSEGNPLFVKELARQLEGQGDDGAGDGLPAPVDEVFRRRLARLAPSTQRALAVAAVLGRDFSLDVVARTWDGDGALPASWLEEAVRAQVISVHRNGGLARFAHVMFQEALYSRLETARRADLHRRAAQVLDAMLVAPSAAELSAIAHHYSEGLAGGADAAKAAAHNVAAARACSELLAYEEAVDHYRSALRALEWNATPDPAAYAEVLLGLGEAEDQAGTPAAARETFLRVAAAARRIGDAALLARAALGYTIALDRWAKLHSGSVEEPTRGVAIGLLAEGLAGLSDQPSDLRARVQAQLSVIDTRRDTAERDRLSAEAVAHAERAGSAVLLAETVSARREICWSPIDIAQRLEMARTIIALAERTGDREHELRGRFWRLTDLLELGEVTLAQRELARCEQLAERLAQLKHVYFIHVLHASFALLAGRFVDAERHADTALAIGTRMRISTAATVYGAQVLGIRREQGRLEEFEPMVRAGFALYPLHAIQCALAYMLSEMEQYDEARKQFELLAAEDFADLPPDGSYLISLVLLSETCIRLRDRRRAALLYDLMLPFAGRNAISADGITATGAVSHQLGGLMAVLERWPESEQHYRDALAFNVRVGALAYLGQIQRAYGEMLLARNAAGDRERGRAMLSDAIATAERYGSHGLKRRALAVLDAASLTPVQAVSDAAQ